MDSTQLYMFYVLDACIRMNDQIMGFEKLPNQQI